ncbi:uncharacterized protein LY89DRAFT_62824 [Mollisia scopiformis]|uniref:Alpha-1,3-mannosyltransferase CMT1 n=1 Tax=Mollisia scopiformis TaxID=149040 RepID=A0A194X929_MOLSC|nr:uncharacterized protein LY89DRAFT_62824 [Mollisia scopiformis]KUJ16676.1 hypothetical protein LY89DRAFT_62824 [Mollisia scopiformis]
MNFLGPEKCTLSIVEGHSTDGTFEILKLLRSTIEQLGASYSFVSSGLDSKVGGRIEILAKFRNLALEPLMGSSNLDKTTVVFLNDVAICSEDILELIHQRVQQKADMTCAMDWTYVGNDPTFYDVWIARGMTGDSFFDIPEDGNWDSAWNLFWNDPMAQSRLNNRQPIQVFSCWNGAVVFAGEVLKKIKFRRSGEVECYQGEPKLFCKDMWYHGYGKIAVVPSVSIIYSDDDMRKIKALIGFTSDWTDKEREGQQIEWNENPPELVKCMRNYQDQTWVPWNESLPLKSF